MAFQLQCCSLVKKHGGFIWGFFFSTPRRRLTRKIAAWGVDTHVTFASAQIGLAGFVLVPQPVGPV